MLTSSLLKGGKYDTISGMIVATRGAARPGGCGPKDQPPLDNPARRVSAFLIQPFGFANFFNGRLTQKNVAGFTSLDRSHMILPLPMFVQESAPREANFKND
jgi:hypothetical protein